MKKPSTLSICHLVILCVTVSCQLRRPRIVSRPTSPLIVNSTGNATLNWKFQLRPNETWTNNIYELSFGIWKFPGFLKTKLMVIDKHGGVLTRPNYAKKISCKFNMSLLEVEFTLHNLIKEDEKEYGIHVEFGLSRSPLTDTVLIRLEDPPKITTPLQRDVAVRTGNDLEIKCQASGFPIPNVTWTRLERTIGNQALILKRIRTSDSGVYLCRAHNKAGKDIKEIIVDVISDTNDKLPKTSKVPSMRARASKYIIPVKTSLVVTFGFILKTLLLN